MRLCVPVARWCVSNQSANFAIDALHLPVKNVVAGLPRKDYFSSGSILEVITDPAQPVMAGMPERAKVFVDGSPVFTTLDGFEGAALAKYAREGSPRLSGYLLGEKYVQGVCGGAGCEARSRARRAHRLFARSGVEQPLAPFAWCSTRRSTAARWPDQCQRHDGGSGRRPSPATPAAGAPRDTSRRARTAKRSLAGRASLTFSITWATPSQAAGMSTKSHERHELDLLGGTRVGWHIRLLRARCVWSWRVPRPLQSGVAGPPGARTSWR